MKNWRRVTLGVQGHLRELYFVIGPEIGFTSPSLHLNFINLEIFHKRQIHGSKELELLMVRNDFCLIIFYWVKSFLNWFTVREKMHKIIFLFTPPWIVTPPHTIAEKIFTFVYLVAIALFIFYKFFLVHLFNYLNFICFWICMQLLLLLAFELFLLICFEYQLQAFSVYLFSAF